MKTYRVYCFDGASRIMGVEIVQATNDAVAVQTAKRLNNGIRREVWDRERLIARIAVRDAAPSS